MEPDPNLPSIAETDALVTPVLATTSILFYVRGFPYTDNEEACQIIDAVTERFQAAVREAFERDSTFEVIGAVSYRYPGEEGSNVYRCARCGQWLTDDNQPNPCDGLMSGYLVGGEYLCDQHFELAVMSGLIPPPEGFWTSADEDVPDAL